MATAAAVAAGTAVAGFTAPVTASNGPSPVPVASPLAAAPARPATAPARIVVDAPVAVVIPTLDITMAVSAVGVRDDGQLDVPEDPRIAGWYRFGAAPAGSAGATVLAAHVDSRRHGIGPFARLGGLQPGDPVIVRVVGGEIGYRVTEVRAVAKDQLDPDGLFDRSGPARLHLVTCGGDYDRSRGWSSNVIVIAERVD